jgi:hypothetical protein
LKEMRTSMRNRMMVRENMKMASSIRMANRTRTRTTRMVSSRVRVMKNKQTRKITSSTWRRAMRISSSRSRVASPTPVNRVYHMYRFPIPVIRGS